MGDITDIIDSNGNIIVKYVYDAWGNHKVCNPNGSENASESFIGNLNPFRYRGYYYDVETQLFYCNSRYYSPELCRFISPDSIEYLDPESINGLNLYCYCKNNPMMYTDPDGHFVINTLLLIAAGIIISGAIEGGVAAAMTGGNVGDVLTGVVKGAANGVVLSLGIGLTIGGICVGWNTRIGSIMTTYGISITANMLEVAITQSKKSFSNGKYSWNRKNDVTNAMFANIKRILLGRITDGTIGVQGTRIVTKFSVVKDFFDKVNLNAESWKYSIAFVDTFKTFWTEKAHVSSLFLSYGFAAYQVFKFLDAFFGEPNYNNDTWILYE